MYMYMCMYLYMYMYIYTYIYIYIYIYVVLCFLGSRRFPSCRFRRNLQNPCATLSKWAVSVGLSQNLSNVRNPKIVLSRKCRAGVILLKSDSWKINHCFSRNQLVFWMLLVRAFWGPKGSKRKPNLGPVHMLFEIGIWFGTEETSNILDQQAQACWKCRMK